MSGDDPVALCLAGRISPEVAIARLVLAGLSPEQIAERLAAPRLHSPLPLREGVGGGFSALARLLTERRDGIERLARMLAESGLDHASETTAPEPALARIRAAFDRAVAASPEASVAAYSLGDAAILDAATAELIDWLAGKKLIGAETDVLDLGCGIGRVAAALAPRCRSVLGVDLSPGMIAVARQRHATSNVRFVLTDGHDLSALPDAGLDLVLAVDSFPYLVQAGGEIAERHVADAARLLRPRGALAILNVSYRSDLCSDRADVSRWADRYELKVTMNGEAPFLLWDGAAFVLELDQLDQNRNGVVVARQADNRARSVQAWRA